VVEHTPGPCEVGTKYFLNVMILVGVFKHYVIDRRCLALVFYSAVEVKLFFSLVTVNVVYLSCETEEIAYTVIFLVCFSFVILMNVIIKETNCCK